MTEDDEYKFKLAKYLLDYAEHNVAPEIDATEYTVEARLYHDDQIVAEIDEILRHIKPYAKPSLAGFHAFTQHHLETPEHIEREKKHELLEEHHIHDTDLLAVLKEFIIMTLALLIKLERLHKKHILCGNINPYTFIYSKKRRACEPVDLGVVLSDKNIVHAEEQPFGDYIYVVTDLSSMSYNKYLAPELKESIRIFHLERRLKLLGDEAEKRGIANEQRHEIDVLTHELHQHGVRYSNRSEIYSVGYTINQIFSHVLSKLIHCNLRMNEFPEHQVEHGIIYEAELLLPDSFANPQDERIVKLVNEAIKYIYDLMKEHMESRDTLKLSIEKFTSLLKRTTLTKPDSVVEREEEIEEHELEVLHEEKIEEEAEEVEEKEEELEDEEREGNEDTEEEREEVEIEKEEEPESEESERDEEEEVEEPEEEEVEEPEEEEVEEPEEEEAEEPEEEHEEHEEHEHEEHEHEEHEEHEDHEHEDEEHKEHDQEHSTHGAGSHASGHDEEHSVGHAASADHGDESHDQAHTDDRPSHSAPRPGHH